MNVNKTKILFTGDMEKEEEKDLITNGKLSFDILKENKRWPNQKTKK